MTFISYLFLQSQTFQCHGNGLIISTCTGFCQASASWHQPYPPLDCHARVVKFSHRNNHCKLAWAPRWADNKGAQRKEKWEFCSRETADEREVCSNERNPILCCYSLIPPYSSWLLSEFPPCDNTPPPAAAAVVHVQPATSDNVLDIPHWCRAR